MFVRSHTPRNQHCHRHHYNDPIFTTVYEHSYAWDLGYHASHDVVADGGTDERNYMPRSLFSSAIMILLLRGAQWLFETRNWEEVMVRALKTRDAESSAPHANGKSIEVKFVCECECLYG